MSFKDVFSFLFVSQSFLPSADDHQALIWDIQQMPRAIEDPILAYTAEGEINNVQWASTQPDWIAICYNNCLEILRVWTADIYCTCEGVFFYFRFVLVFFFSSIFLIVNTRTGLWLNCVNVFGKNQVPTQHSRFTFSSTVLRFFSIKHLWALIYLLVR